MRRRVFVIAVSALALLAATAAPAHHHVVVPAALQSCEDNGGTLNWHRFDSDRVMTCDFAPVGTTIPTVLLPAVCVGVGC